MESAADFLLQLACGTHPSLSDEHTPGLQLTASTRAQLEEHVRLSQLTLRTEVAPSTHGSNRMSDIVTPT